MIYLYTKYNHYRKFINENKTDKLFKGLKILTQSNKFSSLLQASNLIINEEIFDNPIKCDYNIKTTNNHTKIVFSSKNDNEYRLDIYRIIENNELINHISFTINDDKFDKIPTTQQEQDDLDIEYERLTNKNEIYDVLGRIRYILIDIVSQEIINNDFCIGGTEFFKKNSLYEYFLKIVVGENGFEKKQTKIYPKIGWGLYFKI